MVSRVEVDGTRETTRVKKTICIVDITQVGCSTLCHQQYLDMIGVIRNKKSMMIKVTGYNYLVKQLHYLAARLVDGTDDSPALTGQSPQDLHHTCGHEAVQTRGWLITEHDGRVGQNL